MFFSFLRKYEAFSPLFFRFVVECLTGVVREYEIDSSGSGLNSVEFYCQESGVFFWPGGWPISSQKMSSQKRPLSKREVEEVKKKVLFIVGFGYSDCGVLINNKHAFSVIS